ncbi:hypothetical protein AVEN_157671-1 [Araneus ventricosus]|uniref:Uncharacterized protein n=1 Tax=Araneus ventricosus TaxID=182803 RepID=A0A4Y2T926_ARAVE|nr:hypothetical protein AVEN_267050-1 [Araneus ventricosus]GBN95909.1 hypothetical protein AVEN_157671-1 [Araneus ventricosus]
MNGKVLKDGIVQLINNDRDDELVEYPMLVYGVESNKKGKKRLPHSCESLTLKGRLQHRRSNATGVYSRDLNSAPPKSNDMNE